MSGFDRHSDPVYRYGRENQHGAPEPLICGKCGQTNDTVKAFPAMGRVLCGLCQRAFLDVLREELTKVTVAE